MQLQQPQGLFYFCRDLRQHFKSIFDGAVGPKGTRLNQLACFGLGIVEFYVLNNVIIELHLHEP